MPYILTPFVMYGVKGPMLLVSVALVCQGMH